MKLNTYKGDRMDEKNVDTEVMKMCYIEFITEETNGVDVKRRSSTIRGDTLKDCLKYTHILHEKDR